MQKRTWPALDKNLFWDVDYQTLDFNKNKEFIIARVLSQGDIDDFNKIKDHYGLRLVKLVARQLKYFLKNK